MALWLLLTSTVSSSEVLTGLAAAAIAASVATVVRAQEPASSVLRPSWARYAIAIPMRVAFDTWALTVALARQLGGRRVRGRFVEVRTPPTRTAPERRAMQALATIAVGMGANHVVVGFDDEQGVALLHELVPRRHERLERVLLGS